MTRGRAAKAISLGNTLLLCLSFALIGCDEGESDGAIWRDVSASRMGQTFLFGGSECTPIALGTDTGASEGTSSWDLVAIHSVSEDGSVREAIYIKPEGATTSFDLSTDSGELAQELELDRASFEQRELLEVDVSTHEGEVVHVAYWLDEACGDPNPPPGFDSPSN